MYLLLFDTTLFSRDQLARCEYILECLKQFFNNYNNTNQLKSLTYLHTNLVEYIQNKDNLNNNHLMIYK